LIPGTNGELELGKRIYNWVWYRKYPEASDELRDVMTDVDGKEHHFSVPIGKIRPKRVDQQKSLAQKLLAPCVAELIRKTKGPFIQAITDIISPQAVLSSGRVLLVGDAFATLRPLAGLGLNQAAKGAMSLVDVLEGRLSLDEWEQNASAFAKQARDKGIRREIIFELGSTKTPPVTGVTKQNNKL
jgi:2-polyprenyl-6-methoxyphenol hydroxylase-like FAD-dependent oxidoreductase